MCLKSFIRHFKALFLRYDVQKKIISGQFRVCSMMIFLYHFNIFLSVFLGQNVRYFMQEYCIFIHCL